MFYGKIDNREYANHAELLLLRSKHGDAKHYYSRQGFKNCDCGVISIPVKGQHEGLNGVVALTVAG